MTEETRKKVEKIIGYCATQADIYNNYQMSSKILINSIYGAFGFSGFYFYNKNIAESVTKQGKNVILNAEVLMNKWAQKVWQKDTKTHKKMGIKISDENPIKQNISVYIDTDSIYASYEQIINVTDWFDHNVWRLTKIEKATDLKSFMYVSQGGYPTLEDAQSYFEVDKIDTDKYEFEIDEIEPAGREFCLTLDRVFMHDFLKKIHEKYAEDNQTPNILDFELEAYNEAGIWLAKKKYIKNVTWAEPNVYYDSCSKIKATGVEIAQTSSSPWVKKQLTDLVTWIFKEENFVFDNFAKEVSKVRKQFMLQNVDTISVNKGMNKYEQYVMNDTNEIELRPKSMVTVQGAALYNYMLNNNEKYKKKYSVLVDSDKLCVVYIKPTKRYTYWKLESQVKVSDYLRNPEQYKLLNNETELIRPTSGKPYEVYTNIMSLAQCEAFSYPAGLFPMDLASDIDIDMGRMFDLLVLGPINRIVTAMGYSPIDFGMGFESGLW
jgi:DNA polymerase elongation subunit (family B)